MGSSQNQAYGLYSDRQILCTYYQGFPLPYNTSYIEFYPGWTNSDVYGGSYDITPQFRYDQQIAAQLRPDLSVHHGYDQLESNGGEYAADHEYAQQPTNWSEERGSDTSTATIFQQHTMLLQQESRRAAGLVPVSPEVKNGLGGLARLSLQLQAQREAEKIAVGEFDRRLDTTKPPKRRGSQRAAIKAPLCYKPRFGLGGLARWELQLQASHEALLIACEDCEAQVEEVKRSTAVKRPEQHAATAGASKPRRHFHQQKLEKRKS